ncbi:MAG: flagellin [Roseburia sp.]
MVVQHNLTAMNSNRMLGITTGQQAKSSEKLSSGYKINRAADDAAGLSISEKMRKQIRGLDQASTNAQDGVSAVQTAEGALTEVHSMLQRMNELAVQASNGTNSKDDRQALQNEIAQLTKEIDRVAETTKFNETYLLKGDGTTVKEYMKAHDAGLKGTMTETLDSASFVIDELKDGQSVTIGGKEYTIGSKKATITKKITDTLKKDGDKVTIDGKTYTVGNATDIDKGTVTLGDIQAKLLPLVGDSSTVQFADGTVMKGLGKDDNNDGVSDSDSSVITAEHAYDLMEEELTKANSIGVSNAAGEKATVNVGTPANGEVQFTISKGYADVSQKLSFNLHVGADADMTNKINVDISAMDAAYLGVKGLNIADDTGVAATYAVDAIGDALAKVSAQRSALGAVQNRLEHTIDNLDNIVENTTAAESRIRDTDMAEEMVEYSKNNILAQAGQSMLAQSNQATQGVLALLQ